MEKLTYADKIVLSVCEAFLPNDYDDHNVVTKVADFVCSSVKAIPPHLRIPFRLALFLFDWSCLLASLKLFHLSTWTERKQYIDSNFVTRIKPFTMLLEAVRSLVLLAYYDLEETWERLGYHPKEQVIDVIRMRESKIG